MTLLRALVAGVLLAVPLSAFAQRAPTAPPPAPSTAVATTAYTWRNVKIVAGGFITGIVFSPAERDLIYTRTDIGGAYRFDNGTNRWVPLTDWVGPRESNFMGVESLAPDPVDPNRVYLALGTYLNGRAAIARSADRGNSFQITPLPVAMGGNEDGRGMGERLAVDPASPEVVYFGSRRDGLWKSVDRAVMWSRVESFPFTAHANRPAGGISFVVFVPQDAAGPSKTIYAGVADPSPGLYRSTDAGASWQKLPAPAPFDALIPHRAVIDHAGTLYVSYANHIGPNGATAGAVARLADNTFSNITPPPPPNGRHAGFAGIALDAQRPGTVMVATLDRWSPGDDIYRTTDGGKTWKALAGTATRDPALSPYLYWGQREPRFGWWLAAVALDPFDSNRALYGTGATIWGTRNLADRDEDRPTRWSVSAEGIEETAILALVSPPAGPPLISGIGDIGGFTHEDLTVSPRSGMHENPRFTNTNAVEVAWLKPSVVVRSGTPGGAGAARDPGATAAVSEDSGRTWRPIALPENASEVGGAGGNFFGNSAFFSLASDGSSLLTRTAGGYALSRDLGRTWLPATNLPPALRPVADRALPATFYALDPAANKRYTSTNGGESFVAGDVAGLPRPAPNASPANGGRRLVLHTSFTAPGQLYVLLSNGLYHSEDAGKTFARLTDPTVSIHDFTLGAHAPPRHDPTSLPAAGAPAGAVPTIFFTGTLRNQPGFFRSTDHGRTFTRINDDQHQFGAFPTVITADPRVFGRLYIGTNGRGILYGDPLP